MIIIIFITGPCDLLNGNCEQICVPVGQNRICQCEYGFTLEADQQSCSSGRCLRTVPTQDQLLYY